MPINSSFLASLLDKYKSKNTTISITNTEGVVIASTDSLKIGTISYTSNYILDLKKASIIDNAESNSFDNSFSYNNFARITYGVPIFASSNIWGAILVKAPEEIAKNIGTILKSSIEAILDYNTAVSMGVEVDPITSIGLNMLNDNPDKKLLISLMNKSEIDPTLFRSAIVIKLSYHQNRYFNINLNLGYQSSIEQLSSITIEKVSDNKYLNSQDITLSYDQNTIVVIKSFLKTDNLSRIYLSLDYICKSLEEELKSFSNTFDFKMAYGNLYYDVTTIKKSYDEAIEIINIGTRSNLSDNLFTLNNIMFDNISHYLHPQILNKIILPTLQKLRKADGSIYSDLISCAETFIDNCMRFTRTSKESYMHRNTISSKLNKLTSLTGLDPINNFSDAFIIKILAIYIRHNNLE